MHIFMNKVVFVVSTNMPSDTSSNSLDLHTLYIVGNVRNTGFHKARVIAESLAEKFPANVVAKIGCLCPTEWDVYCDFRLSVTISLYIWLYLIIERHVQKNCQDGGASFHFHDQDIEW